MTFLSIVLVITFGPVNHIDEIDESKSQLCGITFKSWHLRAHQIFRDKNQIWRRNESGCGEYLSAQLLSVMAT